MNYSVLHIDMHFCALDSKHRGELKQGVDYGLRHASFLFPNSMTDVACAVNQVVNAELECCAIELIRIGTSLQWRLVRGGGVGGY